MKNLMISHLISWKNKTKKASKYLLLELELLLILRNVKPLVLQIALLLHLPVPDLRSHFLRDLDVVDPLAVHFIDYIFRETEVLE